MRNTHTFKILGVGEFSKYPIKVQELEFPKVNLDGKEVTRKTDGFSRGKAYYEDDDGKKYEESEVFKVIGDEKYPLSAKLERTNEVIDFEVIDFVEYALDFMGSNYSVLDYDSTTFLNFERVVKEKNGNAIKIDLFKESTTGDKFYTCFIAKFKGDLIMILGNGFVSDGIKEFKKMKELQKKAKSNTIKEQIVIKASDLTKNIKQMLVAKR